MALVKQLETSSGVLAEYWRVLEARVMEQNGVSQLEISGSIGLYVDQVTRSSGKGFLQVKDYQFTVDKALFGSSATAVEMLYEALKQNEAFFSDAEDV